MASRRRSISKFASRRSNLMVGVVFIAGCVLAVMLMMSGCGKSSEETSLIELTGDASTFATDMLPGLDGEVAVDGESASVHGSNREIPEINSLSSASMQATSDMQATTSHRSASQNQVSRISAENSRQPMISQQQVAVIDVDQVGNSIGGLDQINNMVIAKERELQARFAAFQQRFLKEYTDAAASLGDDPGPQDEANLLALQNRHMQQLTTQWKRDQQEVSDLHASLKSDLLDSVRMVANAVAREKGIRMVLTRGQVFSVDDSCDITVEVADHMRSIMMESASNPSSPAVR